MERGTTGGKQMGRNATGRASLHHSKNLSHCFKQIVYLKQSQGFGVCIRDIGIDLFHGAGSDPTKLVGLKYEFQHLSGGKVLRWERTTNI